LSKYKNKLEEKRKKDKIKKEQNSETSKNLYVINSKKKWLSENQQRGKFYKKNIKKLLKIK
jgi:hypothetical protein